MHLHAHADVHSHRHAHRHADTWKRTQMCSLTNTCTHKHAHPSVHVRPHILRVGPEYASPRHIRTQKTPENGQIYPASSGSACTLAASLAGCFWDRMEEQLSGTLWMTGSSLRAGPRSESETATRSTSVSSRVTRSARSLVPAQIPLLSS